MLRGGLIFRRFTTRMVHVRVVRALEDNFMYMINDDGDNRVLVVDPVEPDKLDKICAEEKLTVAGALVTHHHWDHAGGTPDFRKSHSDKEKVKIYGGDERIEHLDRLVKHEEVFEAAGLKIRALSTPCHTRGHICFFVQGSTGKPVVFTGDTLFVAGCGKFFEGTEKEMHKNLNATLSSLPDETLVYPGHEYTVTNLKFAQSVEPNNKDVGEKLKWAEKQRSSDRDTVPSTIGEEKTFNPFMRIASSKEIQNNIGTAEPFEGMKRLRDAKNDFKPKM